MQTSTIDLSVEAIPEGIESLQNRYKFSSPTLVALQNDLKKLSETESYNLVISEIKRDCTHYLEFIPSILDNFRDEKIKANIVNKFKRYNKNWSVTGGSMGRISEERPVRFRGEQCAVGQTRELHGGGENWRGGDERGGGAYGVGAADAYVAAASHDERFRARMANFRCDSYRGRPRRSVINGNLMGRYQGADRFELWR